MSFFIDRQNRRKSPIALAALGAALVDAAVFGLLYVLLSEPLYGIIALKSVLLTNAAHTLVIALVGTAVCCAMFLLRDKRVAPYGFAGLAVMLGMFLVSAMMLEEEARRVMVPLILLYGLAPVLVGNAVTWTIYRRMKRANPALNQRKTIREELLEAMEKETTQVPKPKAPVETDIPPAEAMFGPEAGHSPRASLSAAEEAMLFYQDNEESDN